MFNSLPDPLDVAGLDKARKPFINGYDVYPDCLYSTMTYPAAGVAVGASLEFFQGAETNPADISLTNVKTGSIPGRQKFHARALFLVPLIETTVAGAAVVDASGRMRDLDRVLITNRPQWKYVQTSIQKLRGPFPLDPLGAMGGNIGDFGGNNVPAAGNNAVYQHPRLPLLGGWPMDLIIYDTETFPFTLTWGVQTAITADMLLQLRLYGWRYIANG